MRKIDLKIIIIPVPLKWRELRLRLKVLGNNAISMGKNLLKERGVLDLL
jgi:hypothetical protein